MAGEWAIFRLGDVCTKLGSGATPRGGSRVYLDRGEVALIRSQNVHNEGFHNNGLVYLTKTHADQLANVEVEAGDVLLNITGDSVARVCQVDSAVLPARVNQHVSIIRTDPRRLWPHYLRYFLVSPNMQGHMLQLAGSGGTRNALTKGMIEAFDILAPTEMVEQRAIAHILGTLDDKIELNRRMNRTLEKMARAIFKSWFVDFDPVIDNALAAGNPIPEEFRDRAEQRAEAAQSAASLGRPFGLPKPLAAQFPNAFHDSELGPIPEGWGVATVDDIAEINNWTLEKRDTLDIIDYIEISEVMRGDIGKISRYALGEQPSRARRRLKHGDTVLSTVRPDRGAYFLALQPKDTLIASTGFAVLTPKDGNWAFLHSATTQREFGEELGRLADGGAYPAIRPDVVGNRELVIPGREKLATVFDELTQPLFLRSHQNRKESRTLAALRDTLLPKLISGELRVNDAEKFVETRA